MLRNGLAVKCTFTPLGGKRFRCNQTGAIMSRSAAKAYRRSFLARRLQGSNNSPEVSLSHGTFLNRVPSRTPPREVYGTLYDYVDCPYCDRENYLREFGATVCSDCKRTFMARNWLSR
jgi:hypothetical protein